MLHLNSIWNYKSIVSLFYRPRTMSVDVPNEWMYCVIVCSGKISGVGIKTTVLISQATGFGFSRIGLYFAGVYYLTLSASSVCKATRRGTCVWSFTAMPPTPLLSSSPPRVFFCSFFWYMYAFVYYFGLCRVQSFSKYIKMNGSVWDIHFTYNSYMRAFYH